MKSLKMWKIPLVFLFFLLIATIKASTTSNSWINSVPTLENWMMLGITDFTSADGTLYSSSGWATNNFLVYAIGYTSDSKHTLALSGGLHPRPQENSISFGLDGVTKHITVKSPCKYVGTCLKYSGYGGIIVEPDEKGWQASYLYNKGERKWIYSFANLGMDVNFTMVMQGRGTPFWIAKTVDQIQKHGLAAGHVREGVVDEWGGFVDFTTFEATYTSPETGTLAFYGGAGVDREWHTHGYGNCYNAFFVSDSNFDLAIYESWNGVTGETDGFAHQGKINFVSRGLTYTFDNFVFSDSGGYSPQQYQIKGKFEKGEVDLRGEAAYIKGETDKLEGYGHSFYQPYIEWKGTVKIGADSIDVDTYGLGEFQRLEPTVKGEGILSPRLVATVILGALACLIVLVLLVTYKK